MSELEHKVDRKLAGANADHPPAKKNSENLSSEPVDQKEQLQNRFKLLDNLIHHTLDPGAAQTFLEAQKMRLGATLSGIEQVGRAIALEEKKKAAGHPLVFEVSAEDLQAVPDAETRVVRVREAVRLAREGLRTGVLSSSQNEIQYTGVEPLEALVALRIESSLNSMGFPAKWVGGQAESIGELIDKVSRGEIPPKGPDFGETVHLIEGLSNALKSLNEEARALGLPEKRIPQLEALANDLKELDILFCNEGKRVQDLFMKPDTLGIRPVNGAFSEITKTLRDENQENFSLPQLDVLQYQPAKDQNISPGTVLLPKNAETLSESIRVLDYIHLGISPGSLNISNELLKSLGIPETEFRTLQDDYSKIVRSGESGRLGSILRNDPLYEVVERLKSSLVLGKEERKKALLELIEDVGEGMSRAKFRGELASVEDNNLFNRSMEVAGVLINPLDGASHMYAMQKGVPSSILQREQRWMGSLNWSKKEVEYLLKVARVAINSDRHSDGIKALSGAIEHSMSSDELSRVYQHAASDRSMSSAFTASMLINLTASLGFRISGSLSGSGMRQIAARTVQPTPPATFRTNGMSGSDFNNFFRLGPSDFPSGTTGLGGPANLPASHASLVRNTIRGGEGVWGSSAWSSSGGGGGTVTMSSPVQAPVMTGTASRVDISKLIKSPLLTPSLTPEVLRAPTGVIPQVSSAPAITAGIRNGLEGLVLPKVADTSFELESVPLVEVPARKPGSELINPNRIEVEKSSATQIPELEKPGRFVISPEITEQEQSIERIIEEVRKELSGNLDLFESEREQILEDLRELLGSDFRTDEIHEFLRILGLEGSLPNIPEEAEGIKNAKNLERKFETREASLNASQEDKKNKNGQNEYAAESEIKVTHTDESGPGRVSDKNELLDGTLQVSNMIYDRIPRSLSRLEARLGTGPGSDVDPATRIEFAQQELAKVEQQLSLLLKLDLDLLENSPAFLRRLRERAIELDGLLMMTSSLPTEDGSQHQNERSWASLQLAIEHETEVFIKQLDSCQSDLAKLAEYRTLERITSGIIKLEEIDPTGSRQIKKENPTAEDTTRKLKVKTKNFADPELNNNQMEVHAHVSGQLRGLGGLHYTSTGLWLDSKTYVDMKDFVLAALGQERELGLNDPSVLKEEQLYHSITPKLKVFDENDYDDTNLGEVHERDPLESNGTRILFFLEKNKFTHAKDGWVQLPLGTNLVPESYEPPYDDNFNAIEFEFRSTPWGGLEVKPKGELDTDELNLEVTCSNRERVHPHYEAFYNLLKKYQPPIELGYIGDYQEIIEQAIEKFELGMSEHSIAARVKESMKTLNLVYAMDPNLCRLVTAAGPQASSFLMGIGISACGNSSRRDALLLQAVGLNTAVVGGKVAYTSRNSNEGSIRSPGHAQVMIFTNKGPLLYEATASANEKLTINHEIFAEIADEYEEKLLQATGDHEQVFRLGRELSERVVVDADETSADENREILHLGDSFGNTHDVPLEQEIKDCDIELNEHTKYILKSERPVLNLLDFVQILIYGADGVVENNDLLKTIDISRYTALKQLLRNQNMFGSYSLLHDSKLSMCKLESLSSLGKMLTRIAENPVEQPELRQRAALLLNGLLTIDFIDTNHILQKPLDYQEIFEGVSYDTIRSSTIFHPVEYLKAKFNSPTVSQDLFNIENMNQIDFMVSLPQIGSALMRAREQKSSLLPDLETKVLEIVHDVLEVIGSSDAESEDTVEYVASSNNFPNESAEPIYTLFDQCRSIISSFERSKIENHSIGKTGFFIWSADDQGFVPSKKAKKIFEKILDKEILAFNLEQDLPYMIKVGLVKKFYHDRIKGELGLDGASLNPPIPQFPASYFSHVFKYGEIENAQRLVYESMLQGITDYSEEYFEDLNWDFVDELSVAQDLNDELKNLSADNLVNLKKVHPQHAWLILSLLNLELNPHAERFSEKDRAFAAQFAPGFLYQSQDRMVQAMREWRKLDFESFSEFTGILTDKLHSIEWIEKVVSSLIFQEKEISQQFRTARVINQGTAVLPPYLADLKDILSVELRLPEELEQIIGARHTQLKAWMADALSRDTVDSSVDEIKDILSKRMERIPSQISALMQICGDQTKLQAAMKHASSSKSLFGLEDGRTRGYSGDYTGLRPFQAGIAVPPRDFRWDKPDEHGNPSIIERSRSTIPSQKNTETKIYVDIEKLGASGTLSHRGIPSGIEEFIFNIASICNRGDHNYSIALFYRGQEILGGTRKIDPSPHGLKTLVADILETHTIADFIYELEHKLNLQRPKQKPWEFSGVPQSTNGANQIIIIADEGSEAEVINDFSGSSKMLNLHVNGRVISLR